MAESATEENPLKGKLVRQVEFNSPAKDVYGIYRNQCNLFPRIMHRKIKNVELQKDDWDQVGSERLWTFVDGTCGSWKDVVEAIDDENKSITWTLIEGQVPQERYKSLKVEHQFSLQCERAMAKAILTYEKTDTTVGVPTDYMDFIIEMLTAAADA